MFKHCIPALLFLFFTLRSLAYPEFIGFGYTTCMTCHYNGAGNGALNDYGRGLFAAEIAAKVLWNSDKSDEELAGSSGFLGAKTLPFWIRPSLKQRVLDVEVNPGSQDQRYKRTYQMQHDLNLDFAFNEEQTVLLALNLGLVPDPERASPNKTFNESKVLSREYYLRLQTSENSWMYLGFLDKTFGIRHPDHTAFNRGQLNLGQNNQVHGLIFHHAVEKHELFINPFVGNLHLEKEYQFPGVALVYEHEPAERWRLGVSYLREKATNIPEQNAVGFLLKRGIEGGHSILAEVGLKDTLLQGSSKQRSAYVWTQATMKMVRGLFLQSNMQYLKADTSKLSSENIRLSIGLMTFPIQRLELRLSGVNERIIEPSRVSSDRWGVQSQLHLSL